MSVKFTMHYNLTAKIVIKQIMELGVWIFTKQGCTLVDRDISDKLDHSRIFLQTLLDYKRAFYKDLNRIRYLHRIIMGDPVGLVIDHIDRDATNNMRSNLRACTQHFNNENKKKSSRSRSAFKGVTLSRGRIFFEYTVGGVTRRSKQYYSQKMAHADYCKIKKEQAAEYFYAEQIDRYQLEEVAPKKAKPSKANKTGYVGVVRVGKKFMISFKSGDRLIQEHGFETALDAAIRFDEISFKHKGFSALVNFPERFKVFL